MGNSTEAHDPSVGVRRRHLPSFAGEASRRDVVIRHRLSLKASHFLFTASPFSAHHSAFSKYCTSLFCLLVGNCQSLDRKSTRLNSSHMSISYAVFCLK